jgi:hypothetical protein
VQAEPGALPLLQHTLLELWERREGRRLTFCQFSPDMGPPVFGQSGPLTWVTTGKLQTIETIEVTSRSGWI